MSGQHTKNVRRRRGWRKEEKSGAEWLKNVNSLPPSSTTRGLWGEVKEGKGGQKRSVRARP